MSLREKLNSSTRMAAFSLVGVALIAAVLIGSQLRGGAAASIKQARAFYTVDDGATWFVDSAQQTPPFLHDGKPAVQAQLFAVEGGKPVVGYLSRYNDAAKKKIDANPKAVGAVESSGVEIKRPGAAKWVPRNSRAGLDIINSASPAGAEIVEP